MTEVQHDEGSSPDQNLTQTLAPDRRCCGNCVWWDGSRKFVKRFPQGRPSIDHPAVFYTRVADHAAGHCLAPSSMKQGQETPYSTSCLQFKAFFQRYSSRPQYGIGAFESGLLCHLLMVGGRAKINQKRRTRQGRSGHQEGLLSPH